MSLISNLFSIAAIGAGVFFFLAGTVGLLRFPDALSRLHALTKADNLGLGLVVLGLLPLSDSLLAALKLVAIWALVQLAGATAAQLVGRAVGRKGSGACAVCRRLTSGSHCWFSRSRPGSFSRVERSRRRSAMSSMDCCWRSSGYACSRSMWR